MGRLPPATFCGFAEEPTDPAGSAPLRFFGPASARAPRPAATPRLSGGPAGALRPAPWHPRAA